MHPPNPANVLNNQHVEESETVEFKSSLAELKQILETLSAFSNGEGGRVFVGVGDEGQIKGVDIGRNTIENLANEVKRNTDPPLYPSIVVEEHDAKKIITIEVAKSPIKPVFAFDRAFKRVGKTNQRLTSGEIRELARYGVAYCYSAQIVKGATIDDISSGSVSKFVKQAKGRRGWTIEVQSTNEFLTKMGLVNQEGVTIAAILLFGKDPERFIVQSLPAIREGIINAICHRDYGETSNVQVRIFDDRLEIWSPGKLPPGITVDKLRGEHESIPPNPLIARPFFLSGYIENWGTGTNRIIRECAEYGLPEPEFRETGTSFVITFRKDILSEEYLKHIGLNTNQVKAVMHLKVNKEITNKEYQELNGVSRSTASRELSALVKRGIVERHGRTGRGTVYVLKGSNDS